MAQTLDKLTNNTANALPLTIFHAGANWEHFAHKSFGAEKMQGNMVEDVSIKGMLLKFWVV